MQILSRFRLALERFAEGAAAPRSASLSPRSHPSLGGAVSLIGVSLSV